MRTHLKIFEGHSNNEKFEIKTKYIMKKKKKY